jgi:hypothetical protein
LHYIAWRLEELTTRIKKSGLDPFRYTTLHYSTVGISIMAEEPFDYSLFGDSLVRGMTGEEADPVDVLQNKVVCTVRVVSMSTFASWLSLKPASSNSGLLLPLYLSIYISSFLL